MGDSKRVWIIDAGKSSEPGAAHGGREPGQPGRYVAVPLRDRTWSLFWLCYSIGPFTAVVMRQGRGRFAWAAAFTAAVAVWVGTVWRWDDLSGWIERGRIPFAPWLTGMLLVSALGVAAWSRSVYLAGTDMRFEPTRLPSWLRGPMAASLLGITAPGAGLLATGAPARAALAFWNATMAALVGPLLMQAAWLWRANRASANWPLAPATLEAVFLATFAVGFLGLLGWVASVLDSAREASLHARVAGSIRADRLLLALLAALMVACAVSQPTTMARDANELATVLEREGMRRIPLSLAQLARHLDPARPAYALHVAALFEANGDAQAATHVRAQVRACWQESVGFLARVAPVDSLRPPTVADTLRAATSMDSLPASKAEDTRLLSTQEPPAATAGAVTAVSN